MRNTTPIARLSTLLLVTAGCAATVSAGDGASDPVDVPAIDLGAGPVDASMPDRPLVDRFDAGVAPRDVPPEARACPVVDEDVPAVDAGVTDAPYVVELAVASQGHQCALMSNHTVRCRGWNHNGSLSFGTVDERDVPPTTVPGLEDVEQVVTVNPDVTCTRHRDGTVRCWGSNRFRLLGTGSEGNQQCEDSPCRTSPTLVAGLTDVVRLAAGRYSICAIRRDGSVSCWGSDRLIGTAGPTPITVRPTDVAAMWWRSFGWVWRRRPGRYETGDSALMGIALPDDAEMADGPPSEHLCYRLPDGSARCLGANSHGKVGNGTSLDALPGVTEPSDPGLCGVRSVATGAYNTCAVMADRTVRCWGDGTHNALGFAPTERCVGISGPEECATRPTTVPGLDHVDRLYLGVWGGCAIRTDRSVWCWGSVSPTRSPTSAPVEW